MEFNLEEENQQLETEILEGKPNISEENEEPKPKIENQPPVMTDSRRKLIVHIQRYKSSKLARYLDLFDLSTNNLKNLDEEQLESLLKDIQMTVSMRSSNSFNKELFFVGVAGLEPIVSSVYDVQGMSSLLKNDPEIDDLLEELSLSSNKYSSPEVRLCCCLVRSMLTAHSLSSKRKSLVEQVNKPITKNLKEKYSDL